MIRYADLQDFDRIMEMMVNFANSAPLSDLHNPQYNDLYVRRLLCEIIKNGCVIVGEINNRVEGMLIGMVISDPWLPHIKTLREIAWWVEPEHRGSSLGYRLLREYVRFGETLVDKDVIVGFTLTNMEISPAFDLEKRGWRKVETNYVYEG